MMINKLILVVIIIVFTSCKDEKMEGNNRGSSQNFNKIHEDKESEIEKLVFDGSLKDWFILGSREGYFFPLNIIEQEKKDTIRNVFIEYEFGVYLIRSSRLGLNIEVPLFSESNVHLQYPCSSTGFFDFYRNEFRNSLMFRGREEYLECRFKLINKEQKIYQVVHEEIYLPNFKTDPITTGLRVFTISLKEGTIEYELEDEFNQNWY